MYIKLACEWKTVVGEIKSFKRELFYFPGRAISVLKVIEFYTAIYNNSGPIDTLKELIAVGNLKHIGDY